MILTAAKLCHPKYTATSRSVMCALWVVLKREITLHVSSVCLYVQTFQIDRTIATSQGGRSLDNATLFCITSVTFSKSETFMKTFLIDSVNLTSIQYTFLSVFRTERIFRSLNNGYVKVIKVISCHERLHMTSDWTYSLKRRR
jgi:hypothetical protein